VKKPRWVAVIGLSRGAFQYGLEMRLVSAKSLMNDGEMVQRLFFEKICSFGDKKI
jgi:hypothetical protein